MRRPRLDGSKCLHDTPSSVEERHGMYQDVTGENALPLRPETRVVGDTAMMQHGSFWKTSSTGGVLDLGGVLRSNLRQLPPGHAAGKEVRPLRKQHHFAQ